MTNEEYNQISIPYQVLTKRFDHNQNYYFDNFYKCYNPKHYIVKDENLETLKKFENLTPRDIYTKEHILAHPYGDKYLDSKLVVIEEKRICILSELGQVFLYLLVSKFENGINQFLELVEQLQTEFPGLIRTKEDEKVVVMGNYLFDDLNYRFEQIENYDLIFHLFGKTNSGLLMQDWNKNIEIHKTKIKGLLDTLKIFDFSKVEL
ncbi:hypothetical protein [Winogradskyella sediminis]|uniref:hypothetical protein n=1 Tax=Winogradskyella sediminis TaxID=1382466 RepID=UPI003AA89E68